MNAPALNPCARSSAARQATVEPLPLVPATMMVRNYASEGVVTKSGKPFCKQTIYKMLYNRIFRGEIVHKGKAIPASIRPSSRRRSGMRRTRSSRPILKGGGRTRRTGTKNLYCCAICYSHPMMNG